MRPGAPAVMVALVALLALAAAPTGSAQSAPASAAGEQTALPVQSAPLLPALPAPPAIPTLPALDEGWLVSPSEALTFKGEAGFDEVPALRARAVVPLIDILKPEAAGDLKVKSPFAIRVQFRGQPDTPIDPITFKLLYGALKIDITHRITRFAKVTKDGFTLDQAQFPPGKHRLTLQVQDDRQRVAERELRVEVEVK